MLSISVRITYGMVVTGYLIWICGGWIRPTSNFGVFQETKVTDGIHMRNLEGCCVFTADAPSWHHGGWMSSTGTPQFSSLRRYIITGQTG